MRPSLARPISFHSNLVPPVHTVCGELEDRRLLVTFLSSLPPSPARDLLDAPPPSESHALDGLGVPCSNPFESHILVASLSDRRLLPIHLRNPVPPLKFIPPSGSAVRPRLPPARSHTHPDSDPNRATIPIQPIFVPLCTHAPVMDSGGRRIPSRKPNPETAISFITLQSFPGRNIPLLPLKGALS